MLKRHGARLSSVTPIKEVGHAAYAAGALSAVPGSDEEARARLGDYFAEALLLDQGTTAAKARTGLNWQPARPALVDEFRHGSYRKITGR